MPRLIRLYISQCAIGFGLSALFVALVLYFDIARLGTLMSTDTAGLIAAFAMWVHFGVLFAGVQFGIAIMRLPYAETTEDRSAHLSPAPRRIDTRIDAQTTVPRVDARRLKGGGNRTQPLG